MEAEISLERTIEGALKLAREISYRDNGMQTLATGSLHLVSGCSSSLGTEHLYKTHKASQSLTLLLSFRSTIVMLVLSDVLERQVILEHDHYVLLAECITLTRTGSWFVCDHAMRHSDVISIRRRCYGQKSYHSYTQQSTIGYWLRNQDLQPQRSPH